MREMYIKPSDSAILTIINDKVCEGTIIGVIITNSDRFIVDGYRFKHNGEIFTLPFNQIFYKDEIALKHDVDIERFCDDRCFTSISGNSNGQSTQYYLKNGKAEPWRITENIKRYIINKDLNIENIEGFLPDKLYQTEEQVYLHNDLIIHRDNGDIEIQEAPIKKILLNDKQKELFEQFKAITKEMADANMITVINWGDDTIGVINRPYEHNNWQGTYGDGSKNFWDILPHEQTFTSNKIWSASEEWEITL